MEQRKTKKKSEGFCEVELRGKMHSPEMERVEWLRDRDGRLAGAVRYPVCRNTVFSSVLVLLIICLVALMVLLAFNINTNGEIVLRGKGLPTETAVDRNAQHAEARNAAPDSGVRSRLDFFAGTLVLLSEADGNPSIPAAAKAILSSPEGIRIYLNYAEKAYQEKGVSAEAAARAMAQTIALLDKAAHQEGLSQSVPEGSVSSSDLLKNPGANTETGGTGGVTDGDIIPSFKTSE